ncbi:MAG: phenylalanyl-tRNA synthetase beta subunit [Erysipelotrichaceae bacterium]|nr:MAG: phenylalanyl-tRNA synthetase beta [Erysipelotrichaceae bacterium]TXT18936.1 MAG: phenylalanyl-tRNA synthetase beta subunit [Erysipelotrichaceae bacterium]
MKISTKWLGRYVDLQGISIDELADRLTFAGLEAEGRTYLAQGTNLVIGEVLTCVAHPDSDHLSQTTVNIGKEVLSIICGAPNVKAGQKVIVAQNGSVLPKITIKKTLIKGVESNGMICSLLELGVDPKTLTEDQKAGIEVLDKDAPIGQDPLAYLGLDDVILEVKLTPNRSDCNALWSLAYEVSALFDRKVTLPDYLAYEHIGQPTQLKVSSETTKCPLFIGKTIGELTVKESPLWMKQALNALGFKTINNVVDISNYVMIETGQPLHFYDAAKLAAPEITVKDNRLGIVKTLDESEIHLHKEDIVITCQGKHIGLAGIMGGDDSKIDESTHGIIIEAAQFSPSQIRHTSRRVNLITEASLRFQKGLDLNAAHKAVLRSTQLLIELADAKEIETTVVYGTPTTDEKIVKVHPQHINDLLGDVYPIEKVMEIFRVLRFSPKFEDQMIVCQIPTTRLDIEVAQDLIEEVGRFVGYHNLKGTLPLMPMTLGGYDQRQQLRNNIRSLCVGFGMNEIITYTLVNKDKTVEGVSPLANPQALISPLSDERQYVRNNLLNSVFETVIYNQSYKMKDFQLFEVSTLSHIDHTQERLALVQSGNITINRWQKETREADFYSLKGIIEQLLVENGYAIGRIRFDAIQDHPFFHPYQSAKVFLDKTELGMMGRIHPLLSQKLGIDSILMAELNLEPLLKTKVAKIKYNSIIKVPSVLRDVALVVEQSVSASQIEKIITEAAKPLVKSVEVFDVYTGEHVEKGKKSLAITIAFQATDHTLNDDEIQTHFAKIIEALKTQTGAILRA